MKGAKYVIATRAGTAVVMLSQAAYVAPNYTMLLVVSIGAPILVIVAPLMLVRRKLQRQDREAQHALVGNLLARPIKTPEGIASTILVNTSDSQPQEEFEYPAEQLPTPVKRANIFISYRRQDEPNFAGRLYDRLADRFGKDRVFMDVDSIELGLDFAEVINRFLLHCKVLLVVVGKDWLDVKDARGRRRLDLLNDYVRLEIETALSSNVRVIPIFVEGGSVPQAAIHHTAGDRRFPSGPRAVSVGSNARLNLRAGFKVYRRSVRTYRISQLRRARRGPGDNAAVLEREGLLPGRPGVIGLPAIHRARP
jgi:hypothetical protein